MAAAFALTIEVGSKWRSTKGGNDATGLTALCAGLVLLVWYSADEDIEEMMSRPYLPAEVVTLQSDPRDEEAVDTEVGYVLSSDATWTVLMREDNRQVIVRHTEEIVDRKLCETELDRPVKPALPLVQGVVDGHERCTS